MLIWLHDIEEKDRIKQAEMENESKKKWVEEKLNELHRNHSNEEKGIQLIEYKIKKFSKNILDQTEKHRQILLQSN
jgi:hypothetical protein